MSVTVLYFASLRDAAGLASEVFDRPESLSVLYQSLCERHGFTLPPERLRVAIDGEFSNWDAVIGDGAEIAFIPPVSGG